MRSLLFFSAAFGLYYGFVNPAVMNRIIAVAPLSESPAESMEVIEELVKQTAMLLVKNKPGAKVYITTIDESTGKCIGHHQRMVFIVKEILEESNLKVTDELSANATVVVTLCKENSNGNSRQQLKVDVFTIEQGKTTNIAFIPGVSTRINKPKEWHDYAPVYPRPRDPQRFKEELLRRLIAESKGAPKVLPSFYL